MKISDALVEKLVLDSKKATKEQLNSLREEGKAGKKSLQEVIIANNILSEKDLTKLYAKEADVPYVDLNPKEIKREVLRLIPERIARQYNVVVFDVDNNGNKLLAVEDPDDIQAISFLQKQLGANLKVHVATGSSIQTAIDQYKGNISSELTKVISDEEEEDAKGHKKRRFDHSQGEQDIVYERRCQKEDSYQKTPSSISVSSDSDYDNAQTIDHGQSGHGLKKYQGPGIDPDGKCQNYDCESRAKSIDSFAQVGYALPGIERMQEEQKWHRRQIMGQVFQSCRDVPVYGKEAKGQALSGNHQA